MPCFKRDVRGATALASAAEAQVHVVSAHVDELDVAAVLGDGRVDLALEQVADRPLEVPLGGQVPHVFGGDDRGARSNVPADDVADAHRRPVDVVRRADGDGVVRDQDRLDAWNGQEVGGERGLGGEGSPRKVRRLARKDRPGPRRRRSGRPTATARPESGSRRPSRPVYGGRPSAPPPERLPALAALGRRGAAALSRHGPARPPTRRSLAARPPV